MLEEKLKKLKRTVAELNNLEIKVKVLRRERDNLALEIADTEIISLRKLERYAGVSNVRLVQLRKARKKNVES